MKTAYKRTSPGFVGEVRGFELQTTWKLVSPQVQRKQEVQVLTRLTRKDIWILLALLTAVLGIGALGCWGLIAGWDWVMRQVGL